MRHRTTTLLGITALVGAVGAGAGLAHVTADGGATRAGVELHDLAGNDVGFAWLTEDATGVVHVNVHATGLTPGRHGIHVHRVASCATTTVPFDGAGGHHNPGGAVHGAHAGDLPNLVVNGAGVGRLQVTTTAATLTAGGTSIFDGDGSALIIHANPDDGVTDPTGGSGGRVACGIVVAT